MLIARMGTAPELELLASARTSVVLWTMQIPVVMPTAAIAPRESRETRVARSK